MDNRRSPLTALSLRTKLVLSYLFVIIGTVLVLSYAVSLAAQEYFISVQTQSLEYTAESWERQIEQIYARSGGDWNSVARSLPFNSNYVFIVKDATGSEPICVEPGGSDGRNCQNAEAEQTLSQIINGNFFPKDPPHGTTSISIGGSTVSAVYVSRPLQMGPAGSIGAMFLAVPLLSNDFVGQTNNAILIAGFVVAAVAVLCSFLLVTRFTRPLKNLTEVAERVKRGEYSQRVTLPKKLDELGLLGLTFNEMADTIAADMAELRRQDQMRRDLIANIAHDLATPLTAIQGFSEALADNVINDPNQRQETAQRIGREVQRLRRLVADVQQMSSLEAGRTRLDLAPLDMHALVDETVFVIAPECEQQGIALHNEIAPGTPQVLADGDRITQVLLNLLDNARRHTPAGGHIQVGAMPRDNYVYIWVRDTGSGIDPADLPHIFERFYRADRSRTTATGGSGLGLSIVKAIITAHGGQIWAESMPGQGTRIVFTLPMALQAQPVMAARPERTSPRSTSRTLPPPAAVQRQE